MGEHPGAGGSAGEGEPPLPRGEASQRSRVVPGFDPRRIPQILNRRRLSVILPLLVIGSATVVGLQVITPIFVCTSAILIEERHTGNQIDQMIMTREMQRARDNNRRLVVSETLRSSELLTPLIRDLRLGEDPKLVEEARSLQQGRLHDQSQDVIAERILIERLRQKIGVRSRGSDIFIIAVQDNDPATAWKLDEAVTQAFVDQMTKDHLEPPASTSSVTDEQLESNRRELDKAEQALADFKRGLPVSDEPRGNPVNKNNRRRAERLVHRVRLDLDETRGQLRNVDTQLMSALGNVPRNDAVLNDPQVANHKARLAALEREDDLAQLSNGTDSAGKTATVPLALGRQRIEVQRNRMGERLTELTAQQYPQLEAAVRALLTRRFELAIVGDVLTDHEFRISAELKNYETTVKSQLARDQELGALGAEVKRQEETYQSLVDARQTGRAARSGAASGSGTQVRILEPAKKPLFPAQPNTAKIGLLALVLALGIGLGAAFFAEYMDTSFKDAHEVAAVTGLEVLGTLPRFAGGFRWERKQRRQSLMWHSAFTVTLVGAMTLLVLSYKHSTVKDKINLDAVGAAGQLDQAKGTP